MQLTIHRKSLHDALSVVARNLKPNPIQEVLRLVKIELTENGILHLEATDNNQTTAADLTPELAQQGGTVFVEGKEFAELVGKLPEGVVALHTTTTTGAVPQEVLVVQCQKSRYQLFTFAAESFMPTPLVEEEKSISVREGQLKRAINVCAWAVNPNQTKPALTCIQMRKKDDGSLEFVGCNAANLCVFRTRSCNEDGETPEAVALVPVGAMQELERSLTDGSDDVVQVRMDENQVMFRFGIFSYWSRLIAGAFVPYEKLLARTDEAVKVQVGRVALLDLMKRVDMVARSADPKGAVVLSMADGELIARVVSANWGRTRESITAELDGDPIRRCVVIEQFLKCLGAYKSPELRLGISRAPVTAKEGAAVPPIVVTPLSEEEDGCSLIMPIVDPEWDEEDPEEFQLTVQR